MSDVDAPVRVSFTVNGAPYDLNLPPRRLLSDALRHDLRLTGTHVGCEHGVCGMCTVLLDGEAVRACLLFAVQCEGAALTTVEGLGAADDQHPLQQAFAHHHALQCGFCTPGMVLAAVSLIDSGAATDEAAIREGLEGNLCRCTGYHNIVKAVASAAGVAS